MKEENKMNKFTADGPEFRAALKKVMLCHERRNTIPILGMVRITAEDGKLALCITDLDFELTATIGAETTGAIDTTANPRALAQLLKYATGAVSIAQDGGKFTLSDGEITATWQEVCPASDWPAMGFSGEKSASVSGAAMFRALDKVQTCISTEETRYYLNGAYLESKDGNLRSVATDGLRLAVYDAGEAWPFEIAIMPTKAVKMLCALIVSRANGDINVSQSVTQRPPQKDRDGKLIDQLPLVRFAFYGANWTLRAKMIDGKFPNYSKVIPEHDDTIRFTVSADALRRLPSPSGFFAESRCIKIDAENGIMSQRDHDGMTVSIPVSGRGPAIGLNLRYLMDFARKFGSMRLESKGPMEPARVITDDPALLLVLMPMKVAK